ncbi:putative transcription factor WD40-like family [Lupinus albus]|uniref:Putative transcription factor WD40-like family n=1 Tax=Lupinus albus TaxID=3870 RepID=A0A6A4Q5C3_LUPAL|nr:putative transcription factor WD40-like family [Lupinus albus]
MLISNEEDSDVFFDSVDYLSPLQEFGYKVWVNEPLSVKERREKFSQWMGLVDGTSKVCLQEKMVTFDESSISLEKMVKDCNGAVSNACIVIDDQVPEKLITSECEETSEAQVLFNELKGCQDQDDKTDASFQGKLSEPSSDQEHRDRETEAVEEFKDFEICKKKNKNWWARFINIRKGGKGKDRTKQNTRTSRSGRIHVRQNKKKWMELSALYIGQEIRAHKGLIWTMKFSHSGNYLASGGEDSVVRIWRVVSMETSSFRFSAEDSIVSKVKHDISCSQRKNSSNSLNVLPNKILQIEDSPLQEFYGHSGDVLDLAWSSSDILLSSSTDKTVRLWQIGYNECLNVFHHKDYVTSIQFNPVDENYFISGSIDGKARIWRVNEERVVDWADIRDVITAISYQPDGKLDTQICVDRRKRTSGNKITGIQFSQKNHKRIMITSGDSKVRIFEGVELVQTYKGLPKSGSQMSGSFTSTGKHFISVGDDSRIYMWNFNELGNAFSKHKKSKYSCEYFSSKGVTVAIPWSGMNASSRYSSSRFSSEMQPRLEAVPWARESKRFSFRSWFSIDSTCQGSMTWPEEKFLNWDLPLTDDEFDYKQLYVKDPSHDNCVSETWGLSIVAAGCDGTIKTFHNFGFPVRL